MIQYKTIFSFPCASFSVINYVISLIGVKPIINFFKVFY